MNAKEQAIKNILMNILGNGSKKLCLKGSKGFKMNLSILMTAAFCLFTQVSMASEYYAVLEDNIMVLKPLEVIYSGDNIFVISEGKDVKPEVIIGHRVNTVIRLFAMDSQCRRRIDCFLYYH